jgi:diaminohydroxyphosphoribosylaminopyrimidine deaminase / 5-amino-6-(5-phosphoribosylamino)uracil reductase
MIDRCVVLAKNGDARVFPNPRVGAVVVKAGAIVGEGWHVQAGQGHAEVNAIAQAKGIDLKGSTIYVSLEPCAHVGRTPPCAQLIIAKGIARVVVAVADPGPGQGGAEVLRKAGVQVDFLPEHAAATRLIEPFVKNFLKQEAYLIQKWAMTLDGRIALQNGDSKWITGSPARVKVHETRRVCDGIMVGAGTVLADAPQLDVRHGLDGPRPRPIVWDPKGVTCELEDWWATQASRRPLVLTDTCTKTWPEGVEVEPCWQASTLCKTLFKHGLHSVLVEGGAGLHGWLWDHQLADAVDVYIAPKICGGAESLAPVGGQGVGTMAMAESLKCMEWQTCGEDLRLEGLLKKHHPK